MPWILLSVADLDFWFKLWTGKHKQRHLLALKNGIVYHQLNVLGGIGAILDTASNHTCILTKEMQLIRIILRICKYVYIFSNSLLRVSTEAFIFLCNSIYFNGKNNCKIQTTVYAVFDVHSILDLLTHRLFAFLLCHLVSVYRNYTSYYGRSSVLIVYCLRS